jgi:ketosteroid isomerase-like protein
METSLTRLVENYFNAYETKDRKVVEDLLGPDFVFISPEDDHINTAEFFEKCWGRSDDHPVFQIAKIRERDHELLVMYECRTADGRSFRNVEIFIFHQNKIKSIEVFFGRKSW